MAETWFEGIEACVFDAYGTLFDTGSPVRRARDRLDAAADPLAAVWREKQLQYAWLRSLMGRHVDFWEITGDALDYAMAAVGVEDPGLRAELMQSYLAVEAYPEVAGTLAAVRKGGFKTAILSNGSPTMLVSAVKAAALHDLLDAVLSVEPAGTYKPHPSVYQLAADRLRLAPSAMCFLSANAWDAHAAAAFGFRAVWLNRRGQPRERLPSTPHAEVATLAELPPLLGL